MASPEPKDTEVMFPHESSSEEYMPPAANDVGSGLRRRPEPGEELEEPDAEDVDLSFEGATEIDTPSPSQDATTPHAPSTLPPPVPPAARRSGPPPVPPQARGVKPGTLPPPPGLRRASAPPSTPGPSTPAAPTTSGHRTVRYADEDAPELQELLPARRSAPRTGSEKDEFDVALDRFRQLDSRPSIPAVHVFRSVPPPSPPPERAERVMRGLKAAGLVLLFGLPVVAAVHVLTHLDDFARHTETPARLDDAAGESSAAALP